MSLESKKIPTPPESGWPCAFCRDTGVHTTTGMMQFCTCEKGTERKLKDPKCIEEFNESAERLRERLRAKGLMT